MARRMVRSALAKGFGSEIKGIKNLAQIFFFNRNSIYRRELRMQLWGLTYNTLIT